MHADITILVVNLSFRHCSFEQVGLIDVFDSAWTCDSPVPIWASLASQILFGVGVLACYIGSSQYIIGLSHFSIRGVYGEFAHRHAADSYLTTAASAMSLLALLRYPCAAAAIMFVGPMFSKLGVLLCDQAGRHSTANVHHLQGITGR